MIEAISNITCPKCNTKKSLFNAESILHVCPVCHTVFSKTEKAITRHFNKDYAERTQTLQLGLQLKHKDNIYAITGKLVKYEENDPQAVWTEYVLTNPENENIYLACWNGHWSLLEHIPDFENKWKPSDLRKDLDFEGIVYTYFHKYRIRIGFAEGEFNFNAFADDKKNAFEYINPPLTIAIEYDKPTKELNAYRSLYLYRGELKRKFIDKVSIEASVGIAGNQPYYWNINPPLFYQGSIVMFFILLLFQFTVRYAYPPLNVTNAGYTVVTRDSAKVYSFNSFNVPYDNALMNVKVRCDYLSDDWIAAEMTLTNDATGEDRNFVMETERYSGFTDGESWSEGDFETKGNIKTVEKGNYHFEITPYQQYGSAPKEVSINAEVFKGSWSVFWLSVIILIIANIILGISHDYFEHAKWGEDYDTFDFVFD